MTTDTTPHAISGTAIAVCALIAAGDLEGAIDLAGPVPACTALVMLNGIAGSLAAHDYAIDADALATAFRQMLADSNAVLEAVDAPESDDDE